MQDGGKFGEHVPCESALREALKRVLTIREEQHVKRISMEGTG